MTVPKSLTVRSLKPERRAAPVADDTHLAYDVVSQRPQLNWCWASVSAAMSAYYDPDAAMTKCSVVNGVIGGTNPSGCVLGKPKPGSEKTCCRAKWGVEADACKTPDVVDKYGRLACGLRHVGHLKKVSKAAMSYEQIKQEIDAKRPVGMRIAWRSGGGHFVAVIGYDPATQSITIADPLHGYKTMPADKPYRLTGTWNFSYWTRLSASVA